MTPFNEGNGIVKEYVGGYQDYLQQKARETASLKAEKPTNQNHSPKLPPRPPAHKRKLSYKEQRELDSLPQEIADLEAEQAALQDKLADGSWFVSDLAAATLATERLDAIDNLLLEKLERWSALEG